MSEIDLKIITSENEQGMRLDQALAKIFPEYSRSQLQDWIKQGHVKLNQRICTQQRTKINAEMEIHLALTLKDKEQSAPQAIALNIVYEDDDILILNKPAGIVVHPGTGNPDKTLVNALLFHDPKLKELPRAGIIHRLDKDTTGLMIVGKHLVAYNQLVDDMQHRLIKRHYLALAQGAFISGSSIDEPIGRHPRHRVKMAVTGAGKKAVTHYRIRARYPSYTLLDIELETGRTHQIRVHFTHIGHPLVGDKTYRKQIALEQKINPSVREAINDFPRQALHAIALHLTHPTTKESLSFDAPIPDDFSALIACLNADQEDRTATL
jgi:23S rRNA pseudouridine1911/1915/1917 synthase